MTQAGEETSKRSYDYRFNMSNKTLTVKWLENQTTIQWNHMVKFNNGKSIDYSQCASKQGSGHPQPFKW